MLGRLIPLLESDILDSESVSDQRCSLCSLLYLTAMGRLTPTRVATAVCPVQRALQTFHRPPKRIVLALKVGCH